MESQEKFNSARREMPVFVSHKELEIQQNSQEIMEEARKARQFFLNKIFESSNEELKEKLRSVGFSLQIEDNEQNN
ncbi:MAG TPA: hypothetical protein P5096_01570 [Patescibacteria group bacterium]|nr:hypothetical protein [Patescibacteria group bacterium]